MSAKTEQCHLNGELTLNGSSQSPLTVQAVNLSLTKQDDELIECCLAFQISPDLYQRIDAEALFNLKPEVRNPLSAGEFLPETDIEIETCLKPDLLSHLAEHAANIEQAASYILSLSQEQPDNPLLFTKSWLGLSVKQQQESGETGYRTLWSYISPAALAQAASADTSEEVSQAIASFFQDWTEANLSTVTQKATSQILAGVTNFFNELADTTQEAIAKEVGADFEPTATSGRIFEEMVNFFEEDNWPFYQIAGKSVLQMAFQGGSGRWTCHAKAREEQDQFVFYSVCPVNAPEKKRMIVAEFLTRVNSGMIIGNFELDFADGEVRYKTSIEGDRLSFPLIKRLVYTNVRMMDEYLPGIMSIIYGDLLPVNAIAQIENQLE